jgi:hypothetical protein
LKESKFTLHPDHDDFVSAADAASEHVVAVIQVLTCLAIDPADECCFNWFLSFMQQAVSRRGLQFRAMFDDMTGGRGGVGQCPQLRFVWRAHFATCMQVHISWNRLFSSRASTSQRLTLLLSCGSLTATGTA